MAYTQSCTCLAPVESGRMGQTADGQSRGPDVPLLAPMCSHLQHPPPFLLSPIRLPCGVSSPSNAPTTFLDVPTPALARHRQHRLCARSRLPIPSSKRLLIRPLSPLTNRRQCRLSRPPSPRPPPTLSNLRARHHLPQLSLPLRHSFPIPQAVSAAIHPPAAPLRAILRHPSPSTRRRARQRIGWWMRMQKLS